jgi:hypothetical protein
MDSKRRFFQLEKAAALLLDAKPKQKERFVASLEKKGVVVKPRILSDAQGSVIVRRHDTTE